MALKTPRLYPSGNKSGKEFLSLAVRTRKLGTHKVGLPHGWSGGWTTGCRAKYLELNSRTEHSLCDPQIVVPGELTMFNVPLYRYNLSENAFDRVTNGTDCYDTVPSLHPGLSDTSKCYFDFPMVASFPHFYTGGIPKDKFVTGLKPDRYKHNSFVILEPYTGTPFEAVARMQSNLLVHDLTGFQEKFANVSNSVIPLFWAEYHQEGLPSKIRKTVYFSIVILPPLSIIISTTMLLIGIYLLTKLIYSNNLENDSLKSILIFKSKNNIANKNKMLAFEKETFLKTS